MTPFDLINQIIQEIQKENYTRIHILHNLYQAKDSILSSLERGRINTQLDTLFQQIDENIRNGNENALAFKAFCLTKGLYLPRNWVFATTLVRYLRESHGFSAYCYALINDISNDQSTADTYYKKACELGFALAFCAQASRLVKTGNISSEVSELYRKASDAGIAEGYTGLGTHFLRNATSEADEKMANMYASKVVDSLDKGIQLNDSNASYQLALFYLTHIGKPMARSAEEPIELLKQSARFGNSEAINELAKLYQAGNLVDKDELKAMRFWQHAAKLGHEEAKVNLQRYHTDFGMNHLFASTVKTNFENQPINEAYPAKSFRKYPSHRTHPTPARNLFRRVAIQKQAQVYGEKTADQLFKTGGMVVDPSGTIPHFQPLHLQRLVQYRGLYAGHQDTKWSKNRHKIGNNDRNTNYYARTQQKFEQIFTETVIKLHPGVHILPVEQRQYKRPPIYNHTYKAKQIETRNSVTTDYQPVPFPQRNWVRVETPPKTTYGQTKIHHLPIQSIVQNGCKRRKTEQREFFKENNLELFLLSYLSYIKPLCRRQFKEMGYLNPELPNEPKVSFLRQQQPETNRIAIKKLVNSIASIAPEGTDVNDIPSLQTYLTENKEKMTTEIHHLKEYLQEEKIETLLGGIYHIIRPETLEEIESAPDSVNPTI